MRTLKVKLAIVLMLAVSLGYSQEKKKMHHDHNKMESGEMKMAGNEAPKFKDKEITAAYAGYSNLKKAILESNQAMAKEEAEQFLGTIAKVDGTEQIQKAATKVAAGPDLESQKAAFSELSSEFAVFLKNGRLTENQLFLARCPMANSNSGGIWLSHIEEIQNPFFGGKMLKCGSIQETIK